MAAIFRTSRQSELSQATAGVCFVGGILATAAVTVFYDEKPIMMLLNASIAVSGFVIGFIVLALGYKLERRLAFGLILIIAVLLLLVLSFTSSVYRGINIGLLFWAISVYLVWFGEIKAVRIFSMIWLAIYCIVMFIRFGEESVAVTATLIILTAAIGECVGIFKRRLDAATLTDPLCHVWNRRGLVILLDKSIRVAQRSGDPLSVLYLDLDNFKTINDEFGHAEGDRVLQNFARQIDSYTRPEDILARVGGDEFVLVLPGQDYAGAFASAQRLTSAIQGCNWSFGIAEMRQAEQPDQLMDRADHHMFERKKMLKQQNYQKHSERYTRQHE